MAHAASLHYTSLRAADEVHEHADVIRVEVLCLDGFERLRCIELGATEQPEGLFEFINVGAPEAPPFETDAVSSQSFGNPRGTCL